MIDVQNPVQSLVVIEQSESLLAAEHFALTDCGLVVIGDPSFEECRQIFRNLTRINGVLNLAIGDLLNHAEIRYGETYAQLEAEWNKDVSQLYNFKWVAGKVPLLWRKTFSAINENHKPPSFTLCKNAASIQDDDKRRDLIAQAAVNDWNSTQVQAEVERINGKPAPALADYVARAIAPLAHAAEAYPSARRKLNDIIKALEALL